MHLKPVNPNSSSLTKVDKGKLRGGRERVREERYIEMGMRARLVGMWGWLVGVVHRQDHTLLFSPPVFLVLDLPAFL